LDSKVSIITVCYNSESTIEQTILSVLSQTYHNIEYIIVDGASHDHTLDIIRKYSTRIQLISETDDGIYHAMNKGIMKSTGDIVGIINSDDWYESNAVELAVEYLRAEKFDLAYGGCTCIYDNGLTREFKCSRLEDILFRMVFAHQTVFVKKKIYEKYGIFNQMYKIAADYDLLLRFYKCGVRMIEIPANIAFYRMSGISNTNYLNTIKETKEVALAHWDGNSLEIREKIEKYSEERFVYAELQKDMNKVKHEMVEIALKFFSQENKYIIFGAGDFGIKSLMILLQNNYIIEYFVDNDSRKWGENCGDIEVKPPDYLREYHKNVIIANVYHKEEIQKQLEDMGYRYGIDCFFMEDILIKIMT